MTNVDPLPSVVNPLGPLTGSAPVTVISTVESGWVKHAGSGAFAYDPTVVVGGNASGRLTIPDAGATSARLDLSANQDWSSSAFGCWMRCDDWSAISDAYWKVATGSTTFANFFLGQFRPQLQRLVDDEWNWIPFGQGTFAAAGGAPWWNAARAVILEFNGTAGTTANVWFAGLERHVRPPRATVSVTFDDSYATDFTVARPVLSARGFRATHYVIPDQIGNPGYLSQAQVDDLADLGDDIAGHGDVPLTDLTFAEATAEVTRTREWLAARGYKGGDHYAYPLGARSLPIERMMRARYRTARGTSTLPQDLGRPRAMNLMAFQPGIANAGQVQDHIDRAEANGEWLILAYHEITTSTSKPENTTPANLTSAMDYLAARQAAGGLDVLPVSEAALRV